MKIDIKQSKVWISLIVITVVAVLLPFLGAGQDVLLFLFLFFIYLAMANMWNLLAGYSGLISLCQPAFVGLAAYCVALLTWIGVPFYQGVIAGAIVTALFAVLISIPVFRMRGIYFAIGTLLVPEALRIVFFLWRPVGGMVVGGGAGYAIKGAVDISITQLYWLSMIIGMGSIYLMHVILHSRFGLGLAAIRDNDNTADSSGVNVFRLKLYSFIIGAAITGIAGAIFYLSQGYVEPNSVFNIRWTVVIMLATVVGGIGIEGGPLVGTAIVVLLHFFLAKYTGISLLIQGVILVGIMLLVPNGILGAINRTQAYRVYHILLRLCRRR